MQLETSKLLYDMLQAAEDIAVFVSGKTKDQFIGDKQLRMAVERGFSIIGEAMSQLRKIDEPTCDEITAWRGIIGFRNVLIHGYATVQHEKTWDIVENKLPVLRHELRTLLGQ